MTLTKNILKRRIDIAAGRVKPELVLKNCKVINVFTNEILHGDIAIDNGVVIAIGRYSSDYEIDIKNKFVSPGLIDGHVHIESSMSTPSQFAKAIVPNGTTTIIADPHEIANVCGVEGIKFILKSSEKLPLNIYIMLPSCVPPTDFETSGSTISHKHIQSLIHDNKVLGLGELMNYPGTINADNDILDKIISSKNKIIDGHAPEIDDLNLNAYVSAGIHTEHECTTVKEMIDRLRLGIYVLIREGSAAKNLSALVKGVTKENMRRCLFCTDDKHPHEILKLGHINYNLKLAVESGIDPISAIKMATINTAECYRLNYLGAIAPGYRADMVVFDDLINFKVNIVFKDGKKVYDNNDLLFNTKEIKASRIKNTVHLEPIRPADLRLKLQSNEANIIKLIPNSIVTKKIIKPISTIDDFWVYNDTEDILKIAVVERHKSTGNIGLGLIEGFGLKKGAIAQTICHDCHNIIAIGDNDKDLSLAINKVAEIGGGICICSDGQILETLPLPYAGLMSSEPIDIINKKLNSIISIAYEKLRVNKTLDPILTLSFMALPVIPEIKITDKGLFDVKSFSFIDIYANGSATEK